MTLILPCGRNRLLRYIPHKSKAAEIGVYKGHFSRKILSRAKPRSLILVDAWDIAVRNGHIPHRARHNAKRFARLSETLPRILKWRHPFTEIRTIRSLSVPAAEKVAPAALDWVYIDADHSYEGALADLRAWAPKVRPDGLVMGHDFTDQNGFGVIQAVCDFTAESEYRLLCVTTDYFPTFVLARKVQGFSEDFMGALYRDNKFLCRVDMNSLFRITHTRYERPGNRTGLLTTMP